MSERGGEVLHEKISKAAATVAKGSMPDFSFETARDRGIEVAKEKIFKEGLTKEQMSQGAEEIVVTIMGEDFRHINFADIKAMAAGDLSKEIYIERGSIVLGQALYEGMMLSGNERYDFLLAEGSAFNIDKILPQQLKKSGEQIRKNVLDNKDVLEITDAFDNVLKDWDEIGRVSAKVQEQEYQKYYDQLYNLYRAHLIPEEENPQLIMVLGGVTEKIEQINSTFSYEVWNKLGIDDKVSRVAKEYMEKMSEEEQWKFLREALKYIEGLEVDKTNITWSRAFASIRYDMAPYYKDPVMKQEARLRLDLNDIYSIAKEADGIIGGKAVGDLHKGLDFIGDRQKEEKSVNKEMLTYLLKLGREDKVKIANILSGDKTLREKYEHLVALEGKDRETVSTEGLPVLPAFYMMQILGGNYRGILFEIVRDAEVNPETKALLDNYGKQNLDSFVDSGILMHKPLLYEELEMVKTNKGKSDFFKKLEDIKDAETVEPIKRSITKIIIDWQLRLGVSRRDIEDYVSKENQGIKDSTRFLLDNRDKAWKQFPEQKDWLEVEKLRTENFAYLGEVTYNWFYDGVENNDITSRAYIVKEYMVRKLAHIDKSFTKDEKEKRMDDSRQAFELAKRMMFATGERDMWNTDAVGPAKVGKMFTMGIFRNLEYKKGKSVGPEVTLNAFEQSGTSFLRTLLQKTAGNEELSIFKKTGKKVLSDIEFGLNRMIDVQEIDVETAEGKMNYYNWATALMVNKFEGLYDMIMDGNFDKDITNYQKALKNRDAMVKAVKQGGLTLTASSGDVKEDVERVCAWYLLGQIWNGLNSDAETFNYEKLEQMMVVYVLDKRIPVTGGYGDVGGLTSLVPKEMWVEGIMKQFGIWKRMVLSTRQKARLSGRDPISSTKFSLFGGK